MTAELLVHIPVATLVDLIQAYAGVFTCLLHRMLPLVSKGTPLRIWMEPSVDVNPVPNKKQRTMAKKGVDTRHCREEGPMSDDDPDNDWLASDWMNRPI